MNAELEEIKRQERALYDRKQEIYRAEQEAKEAAQDAAEQPVTVDGVTYEACYVVNDWENLGYFIGHNHQMNAFRAHGIDEQTDYRIRKQIRARALFPDGSTGTVTVLPRRHTATVYDMGHSYSVDTTKYVVAVEVVGMLVEIGAEKLRYDLSSIVEV